jgi:hypothetical protein
MNTNYVPTSDQEAVKALFAEVRKVKFNGHKIIARMFFSCCGGCAASEIHEKAKDGQGAFYFSRQERDRFTYGGEFKDRTLYTEDGTEKVKGGLYVNYGVNTENDNRDAENVRLAQILVDLAPQFGLEAIWDGKPMTCVRLERSNVRYLQDKVTELEKKLDTKDYTVTTTSATVDRFKKNLEAAEADASRAIAERDEAGAALDAAIKELIDAMERI